MLEKIINFIDDYSDLLKYCLIMFGFMLLMFYVTGIVDKKLTCDKSIIEKTKNYVVYDNCYVFDKKYYCWEE